MSWMLTTQQPSFNDIGLKEERDYIKYPITFVILLWSETNDTRF